MLFFLFCSCSSEKNYVDENEKAVNYDSTENFINIELKQEIKEPPIEIKDEKKLVNKNNSSYYSIQIGSFFNESNAINFAKLAKSVLLLNINLKKIDGFYKVNAGDFTNRDEAMNYLIEIKHLGYWDAFIIILNN